MSSFSTSLSGLNAEEQALSVISNDLSNLNTTAFKSGTPIFSDLFYQMLGTDGAGDPVQVGVGTTMSSVASPFTQGNISTTGVSTDVAIQGNGLFVLNQGGTPVYTRAGDFSLNSTGNLVDSNGSDVMGYPAVNGAVSASQSLAPIIISSGKNYPPNATSSVQLDMNLDASAKLAMATGTLTVPPPLPTAGQTVSIGGTTYTFETSFIGSPANSVMIGTDVGSTLANLAGAINAATTGGQGAGTTYDNLVGANANVTATGSTATALNLQATQLQAGALGNGEAISTTWPYGSFGPAVLDLGGGVTDVQAIGTLTAAPGAALPGVGNSVTIGGTTYTFVGSVANLTAPDDVLIDPGIGGPGTGTVAQTLANLAAAINQTPGQAGVTYGGGTVANTSATVTGSTATTLTLTATPAQLGTDGDKVSTLSTWASCSFGATDLAGGVDAVQATGILTVPPPLPTAGQTVTIGGTKYTFQTVLANPNDVLIGTDVTSTLANLAGAINAATTGGQAPGNTYGAGTVANASATATGSTATTLTLQASQSGAAGDSVPTSTNWSSVADAGITGSFGAADLSGGAAGQSFSTPITVYDSLGTSHVLSFNFTINSPGTWSYQITIPAADVGATGNPVVVGSGTLQFDSSGNLISPSADVAGINVNGLADGAKTLSLNWQLYSSPGTAVVTQTAEPSATSGTVQDGYSAGTLQSYSINSTGVIDGVLSNGQTVALGQIALATLPNYDGLTRIGENDYQTSLASGAASVGTPGSGGSGTLDGGSLEASNVDIATAFTLLIQAERGYEANAKAITTADDVMQASINLITS
jgi:flagellar hook protein FlgE